MPKSCVLSKNKNKGSVLFYDLLVVNTRGTFLLFLSGGACVDMPSSLLTAVSDRFRRRGRLP